MENVNNLPKSFRGKLWEGAPLVTNFTELQTTLLSKRNLDQTPNISAETLQVDLNRSSSFLRVLDRLNKAKEHNETVCIYGDFDADGITSSVLWVSALQAFGIKVTYKIPCRHTQNHGLHPEILAEILEDKSPISLVITCDCGINDAEEIALLAEKNIDTIVTDHHTSDKKRFPKKALAVLNPHVSAEFNNQPLAGVGVSYCIATALAKTFLPNSLQQQVLEKKLAEIAAIGTIADCVPLLGDNRKLVKRGIRFLKNSSWEGLKELFQFLNITPNKISASALAFQIIPRINAASRMGILSSAMDLFLGTKPQRQQAIQKLEHANTNRKDETKKLLSAIGQQKNCSKNELVQIFVGKDWNSGILGLAASKLSEKLCCPVFLGVETGEHLKFSCRSPVEYNVIEWLQDSAEMLEQFGGHSGAAGFVVQKSLAEKVFERFSVYATKFAQKTPSLSIDLQIEKIESFTSPVVHEFFSEISPFGAGNPAPIFLVKNVQLVQVSGLGSSGLHFKLLTEINGASSEFLLFFGENDAPKLQKGTNYDIAFLVEYQEWRGKTQAQFLVQDIRESA